LRWSLTRSRQSWPMRLVLLSARRDADAARRFFRRAIATLKVTPREVITDAAPVYPAVLDELTPPAWHHIEQYGNNPIEADHGRLQHRLRPMRGLRTERAAQTVIAGHAFIQNLRRGHYERGLDVPPALWVPRRSPNSPARSDPGHTPRSNASPDRQMQQRHGQDQQRTVHTGRRGDQYTEIRSGPSEGDSVVTGGR